MRHEKPLTPGNLPFLLQSAEARFRSFLAAQYLKVRYEALIDRNTGLRSVLTTENVQHFRNGSAHTEDQALAHAEDARDWALKIIRYV